MYYRKYFSGSVDATTSTNQYYMGLDKIATGTSRGSGHIKNRSDVIGNALVSIFQDIGYPNAYWDSTSGYFFLDKTNSLCGIYISVQSSNMYMSVGYRGTSYITAQANSTSSSNYANGISVSADNTPFSSSGTSICNYAFYITVKGEPKGVFSVHIGTYNNHSAEDKLYFHIACGVDKRSNDATFCFSLQITSSKISFVILNKATAETIVNTNFAMGSNRLSMLNEKVVLIPIFFYYGFLLLDNTYFNPGIITNGFYEIDGDIYQVDSYYITKCITEV